MECSGSFTLKLVTNKNITIGMKILSLGSEARNIKQRKKIFMIWPTLCVDNFFDEPNKVIELSKSLDYESSNVYPGKRSIDLHIHHEEFF